MASVKEHLIKLEAALVQAEVELGVARRRVSSLKEDIRYFDKMLKSGKTNVTVGRGEDKTGAQLPWSDGTYTEEQCKQFLAQAEQEGNETHATYWRDRLAKRGA